MIADRTTTADIFGCSVDNVRKWQQQGCPHIPPENPRGSAAERKVRYDTASVHGWLVNRALGIPQTKLTERDILRALG